VSVRVKVLGDLTVRSAVSARAEHGEVGPVEGEPAFGFQPVRERLDQTGRCIDHCSAVMAHDMDVVVVGQPIRRGAVTEVGVGKDADLLEGFERAVDGRQVDVRNLRRHLFGSRVHKSGHGSHNALALRSHPQTTLVQALREAGLRGVRLGHRFHRRSARRPVRLRLVTNRSVAVLGVGLVGPDDPVVASDDLGLTRGDGCFEATRVVTTADGSHAIDHLAEHLDRLQLSSAALGMPSVHRPAWLALIDEMLSGWTLPGESILKLMLTRGRESTPDGPITGVATLTPIAEKSLIQRRDGLAVITLGRGTASDGFVDAPWLLGGVKTLSYAVNVAAGHVAQQRNADDVIFTSTDGYVLEGPTSAVVWHVEGRLRTTPIEGTGILASITQKALFEAAEKAGVTTEYRLATPSDLRAADGVWLVSSGRGPALVHTLNGARLRQSPGLSDQIMALSGF